MPLYATGIAHRYLNMGAFFKATAGVKQVTFLKHSPDSIKWLNRIFACF